MRETPNFIKDFLDGFGRSKHIRKPEPWMTTEQLIENMRHNIKVVDAKKETTKKV